MFICILCMVQMYNANECIMMTYLHDGMHDMLFLSFYILYENANAIQ